MVPNAESQTTMLGYITGIQNVKVAACCWKNRADHRDAIRHTIVTRTFFCFENDLPAEAHNVTHDIAPCIALKYFLEASFSPRNCVGQPGSRDSSISENTRSWVTHPKNF